MHDRRKCDGSEIVMFDREMVNMITCTLNLNYQKPHEMFTTDLNMRKICAKVVPKNLTQVDRKNTCLDFFCALKVAQIL